MKTVSVTIPRSEFEAYRQAASERNQPVDELLQEAVRLYRVERLEGRDRLEDLPVFKGHQLIGKLPARFEIHDEMYNEKDDDP